MSFVKHTHQQIGIFDSFNQLTERAQGFIKNSWAGGFADHVFPYINDERFAVLYNSNAATRPGTSPKLIVGALILK